MKFNSTHLHGVFTIDLEKREDERGFFARSFCRKEFENHGIDFSPAQANTSLSLQQGTLRGLHFQSPPKSEIKIVRCIVGAIWDVVVDLRESSRTYGKWFGMELTKENRTMLVVPKGCAHGFITLQPNSEVFYLVSEFYSPELENTLLWSDESVGIQWPIQPKYISPKDREGKQFNQIQPIKEKS